MDSQMTVESFNAYLTSEQDDSPLQKALRELTTLTSPEEVGAAMISTNVAWGGWHY